MALFTPLDPFPTNAGPMKVHNVEWVADGASQFIQSHAADEIPFFLYVGWTLPHGPDADKSLLEGKMAYTPAGTWKPNLALTKVRRYGRRDVRRSLPPALCSVPPALLCSSCAALFSHRRVAQAGVAADPGGGAEEGKGDGGGRR